MTNESTLQTCATPDGKRTLQLPSCRACDHSRLTIVFAGHLSFHVACSCGARGSTAPNPDEAAAAWRRAATIPSLADDILEQAQHAYYYRHLTHCAKGQGFDGITSALTELARLRTGADPEVSPSSTFMGSDPATRRRLLALLHDVRRHGGFAVEPHTVEEATNLLNVLEPAHAALKNAAATFAAGGDVSCELRLVGEAPLEHRLFAPAAMPMRESAGSQVTCAHTWPQREFGVDLDGSCTKCGMSFQRYIHTECP